VFDVDGTLLLADRSLGSYELLPDAVEVLSAVRAQGIPYVLLTNGSAYAPADQAARLRKLGLPVDDGQMLTPSSVAADLFRRRGHARVLVLGGQGVGHALRAEGIETLQCGDAGDRNVDAVYVGWHPECRMPDIEAAAGAIWNGARLYTASDVPFFATKGGRSIGYSYAIIGAIRRLTRAPVTVTGKPSLHAMRYVAQVMQLPAKNIAVIGDDPLVEILMARRAGATAIGVTTGVTTAALWRRQPPQLKPDFVLGRLGELARRLQLPVRHS
jgi:HAD superfamily hydrolase (TIGR01450 family)